MNISKARSLRGGLMLLAAIALTGMAHGDPHQRHKVPAHARSHKTAPGIERHDPAMPAPATHQTPPSERLKDAPNQVKEQVAPMPEAPVAPGTNVKPGQDTPHR